MKPYYDEDGITIYHGDCREVLPTLPKVDLVLTDPPYGAKYSMWDSEVPLPREWLYPLFGRATTILVTPGNGNQWLYPSPTWCMSWFRPGSVQKAIGAQHFSHWEPILAYGKYEFSVDAKQVPANTQSGIKGHPCAKPLRLFQWLISASGTTGDVLDPFMGSGTTLVAAKLENRKAIGIEIEERYCEIAARRLSQGVFQWDKPPEE